MGERYGAGFSDQILHMAETAERIQKENGWYLRPPVREDKRQRSPALLAISKGAQTRPTEIKRKDAPAVEKRNKGPVKREWIIERGKQRIVGNGRWGLPYREMLVGDVVFVDRAWLDGKRFTVRNHIPGAHFEQKIVERKGVVGWEVTRSQ